MIYADNAATTKMSRAAIDAMLPFLETVYGNPSSLHFAGQQANEALENALKAQGILNLNAAIAWVEPEDEYLTHDSVRFHERLGYTKVAHFHQCGRKFGRWYDIIWMEKIIGNHL